jgi:uncharacterized protein
MVELRPLGVRCNIQCQYCYQNPQRDAGNFTDEYDIQKMKASVLAEGGPIAMFGGEPLMVRERDLEELWAWGFGQFGRNTIQTNGTLINDEHLRMFKQYNVAVGISLDGPGELNDVRWHGSLENTRESTAKSERAIRRLCEAGTPPSLIITLHRGNASAERLPRLFDWVRELDAIGVRAVRLHLLESDSPQVRARYALSTEQNIAALLGFLELQRSLSRISFDLFPDMRQLLMGDDRSTSCIWNACDPYTTSAVRGVEGHGQRSNCGRTNKDGIEFGKGNAPGFERYLALYQTPQSVGGCADCRFFLMCKGQCPGTAIDGDWRNRTEHCDVWKALFERLEAELLAEGKQPLSLSRDRRRIEEGFLATWAQGNTPSLGDFVEHVPSLAPANRRPGNPEPVNAASGGNGSGALPTRTLSWMRELHHLSSLITREVRVRGR